MTIYAYREEPVQLSMNGRPRSTLTRTLQTAISTVAPVGKGDRRRERYRFDEYVGAQSGRKKKRTASGDNVNDPACLQIMENTLNDDLQAGETLHQVAHGGQAVAGFRAGGQIVKKNLEFGGSIAHTRTI